MQTSSNYNLKLPEGTDNVKRQDFVDNFNIIDSTMKAIADSSFQLVNAIGTNAYTATNTDIKSLTKGTTKFTLFVATDATGNCTLNLNSYGTKSIKDSFGNIVNNLKKDIPYNICYNGTDFILQGKGGGGNVTPDKMLEGTTATTDTGQIVGTMPNNGSSATAAKGLLYNNLLCYRINEGYYGGGTYSDGMGQSTISLPYSDIANIVGLNASKMLSGYSVLGVTGNIASKSAATYTPGTANQTIAAAQYLSGAQTIKGDANLLAANIISGKSIFGVAGSATAANMFKYATGTIAPKSTAKLTTTLGFTPVAIYITGICLQGSSSTHYNIEGHYTLINNVARSLTVYAGVYYSISYIKSATNGFVVDFTGSNLTDSSLTYYAMGY